MSSGFQLFPSHRYGISQLSTICVVVLIHTVPGKPNENPKLWESNIFIIFGESPRAAALFVHYFPWEWQPAAFFFYTFLFMKCREGRAGGLGGIFGSRRSGVVKWSKSWKPRFSWILYQDFTLNPKPFCWVFHHDTIQQVRRNTWQERVSFKTFFFKNLTEKEKDETQFRYGLVS